MSNLKFKDPSTGNWTTIAPTAGGVPSGGTTGQVLKKTAGGYGWSTLKTSELTNDSGFVRNTGTETIAGDKTFTGTTTISPDSVYSVPNGTFLLAKPTAVSQSPIPKYLWHDVWAFNRRGGTPEYSTTDDGTNWTTGSNQPYLFSHRWGWGVFKVIDLANNIKGSRWYWNSDQFWYCSAEWLVISVAYSSKGYPKFDVILEQYTNLNVWETILSVTNVQYNQKPAWFKCAAPGRANGIRLTIIQSESDTSTTTELPVTALLWLSSRWGDQGAGDEYEYPYDWNNNLDIFPLATNTQKLGLSNKKWQDLYTEKINGVATKNLYVVSTAPTSSSADGIYFVTSS